MQTYNHVNIKNSPKLIISRVFVIELYFERPNRSGVLIISYMTTEPCVRWTDAGGVPGALHLAAFMATDQVAVFDMLGVKT